MYEDYYGLTSKPFHITPDLDFLFLSHNHQKAITCLEYGVNEDTGILLLTGDKGIGKTTLIHHILTKFEDDVKVATIYNTNVNSKQLLELIIEAFGLKVPLLGKAKTLKRIASGLEEMHANGQKAVIIIDDAQNLSQRALKEIRSLSNLQNHDQMLVQIILVGRTEFKQKLEDPAAAALVQRIGITYHIPSLNREETGAYIDHRLRVVGGSMEIFGTDALDLIFKITQGNPHTINLTCDHALVYGFADDHKIIDSRIIQQVVKDNPGLGKVEDHQEDQHYAETEITQTKSRQGEQTTNLPSNKGKSENWQQRIEGRLQNLEQLMTEYNRELREVIKSMFEKERQKNDNLIMKYAQLESESNVLKQKLAEKDSGNKCRHH
jgi:general secretion pathway protein A